MSSWFKDRLVFRRIEIQRKLFKPLFIWMLWFPSSRSCVSEIRSAYAFGQCDTYFILFIEHTKLFLLLTKCTCTISKLHESDIEVLLGAILIYFACSDCSICTYEWRNLFRFTWFKLPKPAIWHSETLSQQWKELTKGLQNIYVNNLCWCSS